MKTAFLHTTSVLLIVFALCMSSCDDMLDNEQHGAVSSETYYDTEQGCLEGLAALYHEIEINWLKYDLFVNTALSDDAYTGGSQRGNESSLDEINEFRYTADCSTLTSTFEEYYTTIYLCNLLTTNIDTETATSEMLRCAAEARVIRAFIYLRLVSLWGSVPLIVEEVKDGNYAKPAATMEEIYAQIEADLIEAIDSGDLLEKSNVDDQVVNVTKQFAQATLGKAYIFESTYLGTDKWSEARSALNEVINSGLYALYEGEYSDQFHIDATYTCESMFEINRVPDSQNLEMVFALSRLGWATGKFNAEQLVATQASGLTQCGTQAYGFMNPSKELYDAFVEMEGEDGYRLNQVITTYKTLASYPLTVADGSYVYGNCGYFQIKLMPRLKEWVVKNTYAKNDVIFRYAEVLMLAAEAELPANGGSQSNVDKYVNMIKTRAGISYQPGNYTLEDIMKEKRLELCYERCRFVDMVRWGYAEDAWGDKGKEIPRLYGLYDGSDNSNAIYTDSDGYNVYWYETGGSGFQSKHRFLPIPQGELDVNPYITQNEDWL